MVRAWELGYGGDVEAMTLDHDPLHSRLAVALGLERSPTLWAVAHGLELSAELTAAEEAMVLAAQRFLRLATERGDCQVT